MTDHVVGGNAGRGRIGNAALGGVVEARGLAFEFVHRVLKHEFIESQRCDACLDVRGNEVQKFTCLAAHAPHAFNFFRGIDVNVCHDYLSLRE